MKLKQCPLKCRVGAKRGFCNTLQAPWKTKRVSASELRKIRPGPIIHTDIPSYLLDIMRWTFQVVGRYVRATLEEWELGFMRDLFVDKEVMFWYRTAFAFITYHNRRNLPLRSRKEEAELVGMFCTPGGLGLERTEEGRFVKQCWEKPDGWVEECQRFTGMVGQSHWSPPDHVKLPR